MRLLLAHKDPDRLRTLQEALAARRDDVVVCRTGPDTLLRLTAPEPPELALIDVALPPDGGLALCRAIRARMAHPDLYIVMMVTGAGPAAHGAALRAGADDCVAMPSPDEDILARMRTAQRILDLQRAVRESHARLAQADIHDALTGRWNRRTVLEALQRELTRTARQGTPLAVVLADVEALQSINETFGRDAGDTVVRDVGARLHRDLRRYDHIGRHDAGTFLIVLPGCNATRAAAVAARLRAGVSASPIAVAAGRIPPSVHIGIASTDGPDASLQAHDLLADAAQALRRSKWERAGAPAALHPHAASA